MSHQTFFCVIDQLPFPQKVDIFASKYSFKLSHYVSRYFNPSALKVDAFSFHWPNSEYVFPPQSQISKVMNKIWCDGIAFIAPAWKSLTILTSLNLLIDDTNFIH